jgi:hypothetical protein
MISPQFVIANVSETEKKDSYLSDYNPPSLFDDGFGSAGGANDFDALLQKARAGLMKK